MSSYPVDWSPLSLSLFFLIVHLSLARLRASLELSPTLHLHPPFHSAVKASSLVFQKIKTLPLSPSLLPPCSLHHPVNAQGKCYAKHFPRCGATEGGLPVCVLAPVASESLSF